MQARSHRALRAALAEMRWLNRPLEWWAKNVAVGAMLNGRELVYQNIVHRDLARLGIDRPIHAVGSAANYSYLYLLIRSCTELPVRRVLELGCGQSTLLLDALAERADFEVVSLEHEAEWAERIGAQCRRARVLEAPLVERRIADRDSPVHDPDVHDGQGVDVLLVDGPQKSKRRSRWGALHWLEGMNSDDFLIIFDDAERRGELDTIEQAVKQLDARGIAYTATRLRSVKTQFVIAGGAMTPAVHF
ncbi:hypothetical protein HFP89_15650 [Wenzhouxiangella sp. XN79A]|uniref:class I SAM-dependent methyltransferase n=1 Tax=Wenzhouxiangella sp. XN79A TaxID=2724193 RepID=UPI00144A99DA|nr:class I SAM-dependent methyltransferase [Wenzhouxiangella sp. XN79A]NKI36606.1 hypothetical protein [Wenzhouxiangella sp. XN79A]